MHIEFINFRIYILFFLLAFLFYSCNSDCATEVCPPPNSTAFYIRLQNNSGNELLAGPDKRYDTSEVQIFGRRPNQNRKDTIPRNFIILKNKSGTEDSLVNTGFSVSKLYAVYYLSINGATTDSLYFGLKPSSSECCDLSNYFLDRVNNVDINNIKLPVSYVILK